VVKHLFSRDTVPRSLLELVIEQHRFRARGPEKTVEKCREQLGKLAEKSRRGQLLSLKRPLMDLFQCYGRVNFSREAEAEPVTGYGLARIIGKFYSEPSRASIALPEGLDRETADVLSEMVDEERARQLKKAAARTR
jgi:hypothetical protein